ncbi:MAG: hypothetical protein SCALA701_24260 [Candidatus Scalindua sp.]|nr:MAG: hypothetical protein SCALA701_24260 [Candidatus Scalindua sp.]
MLEQTGRTHLRPIFRLHEDTLTDIPVDLSDAGSSDVENPDAKQKKGSFYTSIKQRTLL